jgi:CheY-like chemotaxis protein
VAEDVALNQVVIRRFLAKLGWEAHVVTDGAKAVEAFRSGAFPLILMDCHMPNMDGLAATAAIRQAEAEQGLARTPIIALTADALQESREACLQAGMDDFLSKPVKLPTLRAVLDTWSQARIDLLAPVDTESRSRTR